MKAELVKPTRRPHPLQEVAFVARHESSGPALPGSDMAGWSDEEYKRRITLVGFPFLDGARVSDEDLRNLSKSPSRGMK